MVKNFHAAGIEVILDVVYNHTAEAGADGPTLSFRGLDDLGFYRRVSDRPRGRPRARHLLGRHRLRQHRQRREPGVLRLILDSLRYWVTEMHVDGFRFDLMSALTRTGHEVDTNGAPAHHDRPGPGAAAREADRRAVGRLDGRLPRRRVPAAVGGVERPVPRHDARLLALGHRRRAHRGDPARRLLRPVRSTTAARRTPRSTSSPPTTASRCATWSPTTHKHNEANGEEQPRRHRQQPLLELRRRGRDRRPRGRSRCGTGRRRT